MDPEGLNRIRILKEQNIKKNHQQLLLEVSEIILFFVKKAQYGNIQFLYNMTLEYKSSGNIESRITKKNIKYFDIRSDPSMIQIQNIPSIT